MSALTASLNTGKDMHYLLRGLKGTGAVFQELSVIAASVAIVQVASAAAQWHIVTVLVALLSVSISASSVSISALRISTWHHPEPTIKFGRAFLRVKWVLSKQVRWSLGHEKPWSEQQSQTGSIGQYTFNRKQEQVCLIF